MNKRNIKLLILPTLLFSSISLSSCNKDRTLLLLNWGEYINQDLIVEFEKEYNCVVKESITESNELFYSKLKSGTTVYDLVVPSEYMVKKMKENDLIQEINLSLLSNYSRERFLPGVKGIIDYYKSEEVGFTDFDKYAIPYFWGTWGLMYNKRVNGLEEALNSYGWDAYFDNQGMPKGVRKGMYNVPRDAYAASMFHHHLSPNSQGNEYLEIMKNDLKNAKFEQWGTDDMKKQIQKGDLDVAFMWTGDFLDMYYSDIADGMNPEDIPYDIYIPDETIAFMDNIVITKKAIHLDLAHKFIDFFLRKECAKANASVVGYCTPMKDSYEEIRDYKDQTDASTSDKAWGNAYDKYYPEYLYNKDGITLADKQFKGTPLTNFDKNYITKVNNIVNDVKVG